MLSFMPATFYLQDRLLIKSANSDFVWLTISEKFSYRSPVLFNTSLVIEFVPNDSKGNAVERMFGIRFSFHHISQAPTKNLKGLFNCSLPYFLSFQQHLRCNSVTECQNSEDEEEPGCAECTSESGKCFVVLNEGETSLSWSQCQSKVCPKHNREAATMKSIEEWKAFWRLLSRRLDLYTVIAAFVGLKGFREGSAPPYYKHSYFWADETVAYSVNLSVHIATAISRQVCLYASLNGATNGNFLHYIHCSRQSANTVCVCETSNRSPRRPQAPAKIPKFSLLSNTAMQLLLSGKPPLSSCPAEHWSHEFAACDPNSFCGAEKYSAFCPLKSSVGLRSDIMDDVMDDVMVAWFGCEDGKRTVPYTLVCDYRPDCQDASDETFCVHSTTCSGFTCRNGQCLKQSQFCDVVKDCWDGSDEECEQVFLTIGSVRRLPPPCRIEFLGDTGNYSQQPIDVASPCPKTHFQCPDGNCLPVFVRCNGVYDCLDKQDEAQCDNVTCPGYYRCRSSSVCVHLQHLCDGWPQCPQHDDEWLCHAVCPTSCLCQGLSFVCQRSFPASSFPEIRYLDAARSRMTPGDITNKTYLTWLSLASCSLNVLSVMEFPNLRTLDLSYNSLNSLSMHVFSGLKSLRSLSLSNNPLYSLSSSDVTLGHKRNPLLYLDLSYTQLVILESKAFERFPAIQILNVSFCKIDRISEDGFYFSPNLIKIDLRGSPVKTFPIGLFTHHHQLQAVFSDNYKTCCRASLPSHLDDAACDAPQDEVSSCEDLLRSDVYRSALWLFSAVSIIGNMGSFLFRLSISKESFLSGFNVFVTSLSLADMIMGVFLAMVGAADLTYRGQYFRMEDTWRSSKTCEAAGFIALLSYETSATLVCVITLDRFLALRYPFSRLRFTRRSAIMACILLWGTGLLVAALPISPMTSNWQFYQQTGICVPLPVTRHRCRGQHYVFGVMIVFNLLLFLTIASGQLLIYWTVRNTSRALRQDTQNVIINNDGKNKDLRVARRLTSIVVTEFLCWFPVGLLGVLAACGVPVPGEVPVALAILVLPINSALNPLLYTLNMLQERWQQLDERRLLKRLQGKFDTAVVRTQMDAL